MKLVNTIKEPIKDAQSSEIKEEDEKNNKGIKEGDLIENINFEELKDDLRGQNVNQFSDFLKREEEFLVNLIAPPVALNTFPDIFALILGFAIYESNAFTFLK